MSQSYWLSAWLSSRPGEGLVAISNLASPSRSRGGDGPCSRRCHPRSADPGRTACHAGCATQAPAAGRDAGRHARAAEAAAERRSGAAQRQDSQEGKGSRVVFMERQAQVPRERRGKRLRQPVPHHPLGKGGQADRVRAAASPGVAARGRGNAFTRRDLDNKPPSAELHTRQPW